MKRKLWLLAIPAVLCSLAFAAACMQPEETQATEYKVVYMNGDKEFERFTVKSGDALPTPDGTPERADTAEFGYTFAGWTDEKNGTAEDIIDLGTVTSVTSDLTYYAVYSATPFYTVTFVDGFTKQTISKVKVLAGGDATAPTAPEHEGYRFAGWDGDYTDISGRTTVVAKYEKLSYTLTYSVLGSSYTEDFEFGAALDGLAAPAAVPAGLTFIKWQAENADGELVAVKDAYPNGMPAEDITVTAKFAVDWDWMGVAINTTNAVYGGSASVNLPASADLTFTYKWSDGTTANTYAYKAAGTQQLSVEVTAAYAAGGTTLLSQTKTFTATADVAKAGLDVSVTVTNANGGVLTYGTAPQVKFEAKGYVNGDEELAQDAFIATYAFDNGTPADGAKLGVGSYTVSAAIDSQNYTAKCTPAKIRVAAKNIAVNVTANDITYGEDVLTEVIADKSQFVYGEDISVLAGGKVVIKNADGTEVSGILPAGEYTVELSGYTNTNYNVTLNSANFTVAKAQLTVAVGVNKTYTYGESIEPSYQITGYVNGEDQNVVNGTIAYTYEKNGETYSAAKFTVGNYTVNAEGLKAANYNIEYVSADFTVNKKALTVNTTVAESFVYGTAVNAGVTYEGFIDGENAGNALDGKLIFSYTKDNALYTEDKFVVGSYTVTADGATAANYTINYKEAKFAVTPATITATVNVGASYVFGEQPEVTVDYTGFAYEEDEQVITNKAEITISSEAVEGYLPVGNYTVTAGGAAAANYIFDYVYTNCEFTVTAYGVTLGLSVNGVKSGTEWSRTVGNGEVPALPQGFTFTGKLALTNTAQGTYTSNGASLENGFVWAEDYKITFNGKDFTNSFALTYNISVSLTDSDFGEVEENTVNTPYTGNAISLGSVTLTNSQDIAGLKIEYKLAADGEEAWSETAPTATDAGVYEVEYRLTAPNYKTSPGSFTSTITQAENEITFGGYGTLTYNGETNAFTLKEFSATFGEVKFAAGSDTEWLNADTYTIKVEVVGTDNYKGDSKEFEVKVNRAANTLTQVSAVENLVFNNTQQNFDISGHFTAANGTPAIVSGDKFGFNADEYTFTVQVAESENYLASNAIQVTVTIAKATNNVISGNNTLEFTYNGSLQDFLEGNQYTATYGEVKFKEETSATDAGEYQFTVYVEETANYNGDSLEVNVVIERASYTGEEDIFNNIMTDKVIYYDEDNNTLAYLAANGYLANGFSWKNDTATYSVGNNESVYVIYNADSKTDSNYEPFETQVSFNVYNLLRVTIGDVSQNADFNKQIGTVSSFTGDAYAPLKVEVVNNNSAFTVGNIATYVQADTDAIDFAVGSTYPIVYAATDAAEDNYVKVVFGTENAETGYAPFKLKSVLFNNTYYTIEDALATATSGQTVIVAGNTSFAAGVAQMFYYNAQSGVADLNYYTVDAGITLLVPYENTKYSSEFNSTTAVTAVAATGKFLLTLPSGVDLAVYGNIIVNALVTQTSPYSSVVNGNNYGAIDIQAGATITLNNEATFENRGFTYGEGKLIANSGAQVYELFNLTGYRGGTVSLMLSSAFPLNQYSLTGIIAKTEIKTGAIYGARAYVTAIGLGQNASVNFVSNEDSSFMTLSLGSVFKWIDESNGKIHFDLQGTVTFHNMNIDIGGLSTRNKEIPIPGNFAISVSGEGSVTTVPSDIRIKFLPGATLTVGTGAKLDIEGRLYIYSVDEGNSVSVSIGQWKDGTFAYPVNNSGTAKGAYRNGNVLTLGYDANTPAQLIVNGTLNISSSAIIGGKISGNENAILTIEQGATLNGSSIKEYESGSMFSIKYFDSTFAAMGIIDGNLSNLAAGKTYTYGENGWTVS